MPSNNLRWNDVNANFGDASRFMGAAVSGISEAGNIFQKMSQMRAEEQKRAEDIAYREKVFAENQRQADQNFGLESLKFGETQSQNKITNILNDRKQVFDETKETTRQEEALRTFNEDVRQYNETDKNNDFQNETARMNAETDATYKGTLGTIAQGKYDQDVASIDYQNKLNDFVNSIDDNTIYSLVNPNYTTLSPEEQAKVRLDAISTGDVKGGLEQYFRNNGFGQSVSNIPAYFPTIEQSILNEQNNMAAFNKDLQAKQKSWEDAKSKTGMYYDTVFNTRPVDSDDVQKVNAAYSNLSNFGIDLPVQFWWQAVASYGIDNANDLAGEIFDREFTKDIDNFAKPGADLTELSLSKLNFIANVYEQHNKPIPPKLTDATATKLKSDKKDKPNTGNNNNNDNNSIPISGRDITLAIASIEKRRETLQSNWQNLKKEEKEELEQIPYILRLSNNPTKFIDEYTKLYPNNKIFIGNN